MSRPKKLRIKPNKHVNCVTEDNSSVRSEALKKKAIHDKWEEKQRFVVLRPDRKTTIYRRVPDGKKLTNQEIHKGRI